jgi:hypothetical protein
VSISSTSPRSSKGALSEITPIVVDENGASAFIDVSVSSLQKMRVDGTGPAFAKIGNRVRYRVADLEAYVAERLVRSTSETAKAA